MREPFLPSRRENKQVFDSVGIELARFLLSNPALNLTDCGEWLSMWVLYGTFPVFRRATCFARLQFLLWVLGLTVPSIPRSRLANPDGAFEYGAEREYTSQFMCSK